MERWEFFKDLISGKRLKIFEKYIKDIKVNILTMDGNMKILHKDIKNNKTGIANIKANIRDVKATIQALRENQSDEDSEICDRLEGMKRTICDRINYQEQFVKSYVETYVKTRENELKKGKNK